MISQILQILDLNPRISKVFFLSLGQFFLTVGKKYFGNKIPLLPLCKSRRSNFGVKMETKVGPLQNSLEIFDPPESFARVKVTNHAPSTLLSTHYVVCTVESRFKKA